MGSVLSSRGGHIPLSQSSGGSQQQPNTPGGLTDEQRRKQATYESAEYHQHYPTMYMAHLAQRSGNERLLHRRHRRIRQHAAELGVAGREGEGEGPPVEVLDHDDERNQPVNVSVLVDEFSQETYAMDREAVQAELGPTRTRILTFISWILHILIAILVAFVSFFVLKGVKTLEEWKLDKLGEIVMHEGWFVGLLFWVGLSVGLVAASTFIVVQWAPAAAGSGIPDVIGYLNGVQIPNILSLRTFLGKITSCILCVSGGLPVGVEAPLIHLGAIVGGGVSQGRSHVFGWQTRWLAAFRNHRHKRDFVTAGAACGVAAAFSAPIGGLLFVMEEVASFWDHHHSGKVFLACVISFAFLTFINPWYGDRDGDDFVDHNSAIIFEVNYSIPLNLSVLLPALVLGCVSGLLASLFTNGNLAVVRWRRRVIRPYPLRRMAEPVLVVLIFTFVTYVFAVVAGCSEVVEPIPPNTTAGITFWSTEAESELVTFTCRHLALNKTIPSGSDGGGIPSGEVSGLTISESGIGTFSPLATLMLSGGKANIRHLFTRRTVKEFSLTDVLLYFALYFSFAMYTSGSAVASGLVIPMIIIGALFGRLYGLVMVQMFASGLPQDTPPALQELGGYYDSQSWMDPGVFALIGAAAFFSGVTRLAIAVPVIMVELSGELHYLLPIIIAAVVSKAVADSLCVPLYHQQLHLDAIPFMAPEVSGVDLEHFTAEDVATKDVIVLHAREDIRRIVRILKNTSHHTFPVVETIEIRRRSSHTGITPTVSPASGSIQPERVSPSPTATTPSGQPPLDLEESQRFLGTVSREDLETLLSLLLSHRTMGAGAGQQPVSGNITWSLWQQYQHESFKAGTSTPGQGVSSSPMLLPSPSTPSRSWKHLWDELLREASAASASSAAAGSGASIVVSRGERAAGASPSTATSLIAEPLNLIPILNWSPWVVPRHFNLQLAYNLFRTMGLRHLLVGDGEVIVGIITRKDLMPHRLRSLERELLNSLSPLQNGTGSSHTQSIGRQQQFRRRHRRTFSDEESESDSFEGCDEERPTLTGTGAGASTATGGCSKRKGNRQHPHGDDDEDGIELQ